MRAHPAIRITRKDWIGDAVLALLAGVVCVASVFLPWANADTPGHVNYGLSRPNDILGVLSTQWGWPALCLALAVAAMAAAMLALGPRRLGIGLGLIIAIAGLAIVLVAADAATATYAYGYEAGLGVVVTLFAGVLLIPIGLAAAAVAWVLLYLKPREVATASVNAPTTRSR